MYRLIRIFQTLFTFFRKQPAITAILLLIILNTTLWKEEAVRYLRPLNLAADIDRARMEWALDQSFSGSWNGRGSCAGPEEPMTLDLKLESGLANGEFSSSCKAQAPEIIGKFSLYGVREKTRLILHAHPAESGPAAKPAIFELHLLKLPFGDNIRWRTIDGASLGELFPRTLMFTRGSM